MTNTGRKELLLWRLNIAADCAEQIFICKAEDRAVASATAIDDNAANGDLGKQDVAIFKRRRNIIMRV